MPLSAAYQITNQRPDMVDGRGDWWARATGFHLDSTAALRLRDASYYTVENQEWGGGDGEEIGGTHIPM